jgi:hypothetical protein
MPFVNGPPVSSGLKRKKPEEDEINFAKCVHMLQFNTLKAKDGSSKPIVSLEVGGQSKVVLHVPAYQTGHLIIGIDVGIMQDYDMSKDDLHFEYVTANGSKPIILENTRYFCGFMTPDLKLESGDEDVIVMHYSNAFNSAEVCHITLKCAASAAAAPSAIDAANVEK